MRILAFVQAYLGQYATAPGGLGKQCVDLANLYLQQVRKQPEVHANAVTWSTVQIAGMQWVTNTPYNQPAAGSLVVWGPFPAHSISQYGHIALALYGDNLGFLSFDQDWPIGSVCALTLHDYGGVLGWHAPIS